MNRSDFIRLARLRLREARVLLRSGNPAGAYYLCGYVVECALKACIAKRTRKSEFPDLRRVQRSWVHDLQQLVSVSGLERELQKRSLADAYFQANWNVVQDWSEESRYQQKKPSEAHDLYSAVTGKKHGVLEWIKQHW